MRRLLATLTTLLLVAPAIAVHAEEEGHYYQDRFKEVSYAGSEGTLTWPGPWVEFKDDGKATSGTISVGGGECADNNCLRIAGSSIPLGSVGIRRPADLSMFTGAALSFALEVDSVFLGSDAVLLVEVSRDGSSWATVGTYPLLEAVGHQNPTIDLDDFRSKNFVFRFLVTSVTGILGGEVYIDTVMINGEVPATTTSSSSTSSTSSTTATTVRSTTTTSTSRSGSNPPSTNESSTTTTTEATSQGATNGVAGTSSTTTAAATTSTEPLVLAVDGGFPGSGLRDTPAGLISDYSSGLAGAADVEVLGAEVTADFSIAAETFETARVWIAVLALLITAAIVSGLDRRRQHQVR